MPWNKTAPMTEKERFVTLAQTGRFTVGELCHDFGISRKTGRRGLKRYHTDQPFFSCLFSSFVPGGAALCFRWLYLLKFEEMDALSGMVRRFVPMRESLSGCRFSPYRGYDGSWRE
jgi:hypothetical protein